MNEGWMHAHVVGLPKGTLELFDFTRYLVRVESAHADPNQTWTKIDRVQSGHADPNHTDDACKQMEADPGYAPKCILYPIII